MPKIFDSRKSVFFVGGPAGGTQAGDANAGGCTKDWFDSNFTQLTDLMTANGGPIGDAWNGSQTYCDITESGGGNVKIDPPSSEFANCESGMVANVKFAGVYSGGRYEIVNIAGGSIEIDLPYTSATTCDAKVGGAFSNLQNACDETNAGSYNVTIYTNKDETLSATLNVDTGGGSVSGNTHKRIIGFYLLPGDTDPGGAYYRDAAHGWVDINGGGNSIDLIDIVAQDCIDLRNLYLHDVSTSTGYYLIQLTYSGSYPTSLSIINCKFDTANRAICGDAQDVLIEGCVFGTPQGAYHIEGKYYGFRIINCEFDIATGQTGVLSRRSPVIVGCIFNGGAKGIWVYEHTCTAFNNVFYGQTTACISLENSTASLIEFDNIFDPAAVDDYAVHQLDGTILYSDYSCAYCTAAISPLNSGHAWPEEGPHSIEVDPQFVNAGGGDFRPRNPAVLRGGKPGVDGMRTEMGAVLQEYQFAGRAMQTNLGKLQIVR